MILKFRFCDMKDYVLLAFGVLGCIVYGLITPGQFILFGALLDNFVEFLQCKDTNCTGQIDLEHDATIIGVWFVGFSVANFFFAWMGMGFFALSAERQVHKMRLLVFKSTIYQDIGWFDTFSSGELTTRLTEDTSKIIDGNGTKLGSLLASIISFFGGFAIGFYYQWKLTLVLLAAFPFFAVVGGIMTKVLGDQTSKESAAYAKAGHVAKQSISLIKTVAAFGGEENQAKLYDGYLKNASKFGTRKGLGMGIGTGSFQLVVLCSYAIGLWFLVKLLRDGDAKPGEAMIAFFASTIGSVMIGQAGPSSEALAEANGASIVLAEIIDRKPEIDASSDDGVKPTLIRGDIEFCGVDFAFPTRKTVSALSNFNLKIESGKRVALIGESGCGKSTVVKLIQRFYDPVKGSVLVDGRDIKSLNVRHLRDIIGVVKQEPVLFATTIADNIAYGREGVTQDEIEEAAKMANAHDFIIQFPQGYYTQCGEGGGKMSGGQKQRIAIARALIRNPKILLLDEATSALDSESEKVVQDALDKAGKGRTTLVVAHRLSTVRHADQIATLSAGHVNEIGTHEELMEKEGLYHSLVKLQEGDDDDDIEFDNNMSSKTYIKADQSGTVTNRHNQELERGTDEDDGMLPLQFQKILRLAAPEWKYLAIGCLGAGLLGSYPFLYTLAFGGMLGVMGGDPNIPEENEQMEKDGLFWSLFMFVLGLVSGFGALLQHYYFAKAGEALTQRLRTQTFLAYLRQNIAYYDEPNHDTGVICARLATEVSSVQGATGSQLGFVVSATATIIGGLVVAMVATWKLTLVMLTFVPILGLGGLFMNIYLGYSADESSYSLDAGKVTSETLGNIHTVVSLGRQEAFLEKFRIALEMSYKKAIKSSHFSGLANGAVMGIVNLGFAAGFRYGGYLVVRYEITLEELMRSMMTVITCSLLLGQLASMTPSYKKAKDAAKRVLHLIDKIPEIDSFSVAGKVPEKCHGEIRIKNAVFRYPTRPNVDVLRNIDIMVHPGQTVALVGTSGCGKSTSVSLIERFYDITGGSVKIDGVDVKNLNLKWLRSNIGIVSQEPALFDISVRDNIAYGDTSKQFSDEEIQKAAKTANIHSFILSLPEGYDTHVGEKGSLISGGQKQRIAIARALIRDPKILLLDEATSALDNESQKVVQQALHAASVGRTTLVIAHRLSSIQHVDIIYVIKRGKVIEHGNHHDLLAMRGVYHSLHKAQSLTSKIM